MCGVSFFIIVITQNFRGLCFYFLSFCCSTLCTPLSAVQRYMQLRLWCHLVAGHR